MMDLHLPSSDLGTVETPIRLLICSLFLNGKETQSACEFLLKRRCARHLIIFRHFHAHLRQTNRKKFVQ